MESPPVLSVIVSVSLSRQSNLLSLARSQVPLPVIFFLTNTAIGGSPKPSSFGWSEIIGMTHFVTFETFLVAIIDNDRLGLGSNPLFLSYGALVFCSTAPTLTATPISSGFGETKLVQWLFNFTT